MIATKLLLAAALLTPLAASDCGTPPSYWLEVFGVGRP